MHSAVQIRGRLLFCGSTLPCAIKFSLPSLYPLHHSRDKMDQALSQNFQGLVGSKVVRCNCVRVNVRKGRETGNEATEVKG